MPTQALSSEKKGLCDLQLEQEEEPGRAGPLLGASGATGKKDQESRNALLLVGPASSFQERMALKSRKAVRGKEK